MKITLWAGLALAAFTASAAHCQDFVQWTAPASTPVGPSAYFPMGTPLQLTTRTELNTKDNRAGDRFYLEVAEPLAYRGQVVVPAGSVAVGEVMRAEHNGHFGKKGQLEVRLNYVQTPSGPIRLSGRTARSGTDQGVLAIGGAAFIAWPMLFIHGTSGRLPADTVMTAYLADDLHFNAPRDVAQVATSDVGVSAPRVLPARFDPSVFAANRP
ncbi:MAG: hypothetical protein ABIS14_09705 [Sphingomonas sp.]